MTTLIAEDPSLIAEDPSLLYSDTAVDFRAARASLRGQIQRLERQLGSIAVDLGQAGRALPLPDRAVAPSMGPRLLSLGELESIRDSLLSQVQASQRALRGCEQTESDARTRLEAMLAEPRAHRFEVIPRADLGESGCGAYQVRPRLGILGMLFDWWCVKLSSGCP